MSLFSDPRIYQLNNYRYVLLTHSFSTTKGSPFPRFTKCCIWLYSTATLSICFLSRLLVTMGMLGALCNIFKTLCRLQQSMKHYLLFSLSSTSPLIPNRADCRFFPSWLICKRFSTLVTDSWMFNNSLSDA
jgi:hypothetical protein